MSVTDTPLHVGDWPNALYDDQRFVVWRLETRHGKPTKPPYIPGLGALARNDDPSTWRSHGEARATAEKGAVDGIGYMLLGRQDLAALDLDDCLKDGIAAPWAAELVKRCNSYCEITPSGEGLRIIGIASRDLPDMHFKLARPDDGSLEVYHRAKRYITLSLKPYGDEIPFADISDVLAELHGEKTAGNVAALNGHSEGGFPRDLSGLPGPIVHLVTLGAAPSADRSRELYRVIAHLRTRAGWTRGEIESVLRHHPRGIAARCFEGGKDDVSRHVRMALDRIDDETARARTRQPGHGHGHDGIQADDAENVEPYQLTDWNPWERSGGPIFPLENLPGLAQEWVATRAMQTGADISAFAMAFLHIVGGLADHRLCLQPKRREPDFRILPNIWSMLIGPPSTMKSTVVRTVTSCLRRFDRQNANARAASVRNAVAAGETEADAEETTPPARRRLLVDATIEKISDILSHQNCGATLVRDELSGWLNGMDRYSRGSDRPFWLEAQNGGYFVVDRIKGQREVEVLSIGVFGGIQPERLNDLSNLTADGLFQRFTPVNMRPADDECDEDAGPGMDQRFDTLVTDIGRIPSQTLFFDEEAAAAYIAFSNFMRKASRITTPNEAFGTFLGKQARTLATIALLLHIVDLSRTFDVHYSPVPLKTLQRAQRIVERFILPHAELFYSTVVSNSFTKTQSVASAIIRLADERTVETTSRELGRRSGAIRELQSDHLKIRGILTPFVVNGWLTPRAMLPNNVHWTVNPDLAGKFQAELRSQQDMLAAMKARMKNDECDTL